MMKKDYSIQHLSKIALVLYSIIFIVLIFKELGVDDILSTIFVTVFNIAPFFILTICILKSPALWEKITLFTVQIVLSLFAAYLLYRDLYLITPDPHSNFFPILLPMLGLLLPILYLYPAILLTIGVIKAINYNKK